MDITQRFGRCIAGSSPAGGTVTASLRTHDVISAGDESCRGHRDITPKNYGG